MWSSCGLAGNMPPIVTEPTVIRCEVRSQVSVQIVAEDPSRDSITYSLLLPRPPQASIGSGETHTLPAQQIRLAPFVTVTDDVTADIC